MNIHDIFGPRRARDAADAMRAAPLSEAELLDGFLCPDDSPLLRSVVAAIQGERALCIRRMESGGLKDPQLREEAGRLAALRDLQDDIARGRLRAREAARARDAKGGRR